MDFRKLGRQAQLQRAQVIEDFTQMWCYACIQGTVQVGVTLTQYAGLTVTVTQAGEVLCSLPYPPHCPAHGVSPGNAPCTP